MTPSLLSRLLLCLSAIAILVCFSQPSVRSAPEEDLTQLIQKLCSPPPLPARSPLNLSDLAQGASSTASDIVTASTISQDRLTIPSLWWAQEQYKQVGGNLLNNWLAYPSQRRIDLVVNRQFWTSLDYVDRYEFVNRFGLVARDYNYNVRVFNLQGAFLAAYTCDGTSNPNCRVCLDYSGKAGVRRGKGEGGKENRY